MANTVASYFQFQSKTPARSSEVNNNFGLYRGTLLPINPNTATASNNTWDLGTSDYRWLGTYVPSWTMDLDAGAQIMVAEVTGPTYLNQADHAIVMTSSAAAPNYSAGSYEYGKIFTRSAYASAVAFGNGSCLVNHTATTYGEPVLFRVTLNYQCGDPVKYGTVEMYKDAPTVATGTNNISRSSVTSYGATLIASYTIGSVYNNGGGSTGQRRSTYGTTFYFYDFSPGATTTNYATYCFVDTAVGSGFSRIYLWHDVCRVERVF